MSLIDRLNQIIPRLEDPVFLANQGIGNEVGFYVFDYPPEDEVVVREHVALVRRHFEKMGTVRVAEVNLFDVLLEVLRSKKVLDRVLQSESQWSPSEMMTKLGPVTRMELVVNQIMQAIPAGTQVVFFTGTGSAFPLIRGHEVLNNLHDRLDRIPVVLFYPGKYTMQELVLFGLLEANYYRAFRLIP